MATKSWPVEAIGDVAEVQGGIQKQPKRAPVHNHYPFLRVANVGRGTLALEEVHRIELFEGELKRFRLEAGDLLVVEGNGSPDQIGRAAQWLGDIEDCVHQNHLIRVRPGPRLDPAYLAYAWNAPATRAAVRRVASSTSGLYTLNTAKVAAITIPVPPLDVQRKIVEGIDRRFSLIRQGTDLLASTRKKLSRSEVALMDWAVAGRLARAEPLHGEAKEELLDVALRRRQIVAAAGVRRRGVPALPQGDVPELPLGWEVASLDEITWGAGYGTSTKCTYESAGAVVLRIPNIRAGRVLWGDLKRAGETVDLKALMVSEGDILFVRTNGSRDLIGRAAVVGADVEASFASYLIRFRPVPGGPYSDWIRVALSTSWSRREIERRAASTAGQYNLGLSDLASLPVPVPPRRVQAAILRELSRRLSLQRAAVDAVEHSTIRAERLKASVLAEALEEPAPTEKNRRR